MADDLLRALWAPAQLGLRCVAYRGKQFKGWRHKWFDTTDKAISFVHWLDAKPDIDAVYHACALYDPAGVEAMQTADMASTGRPSSSVGRTAENALGTFGLWVDVDVDPAKANAYPDMPAAIAATKAFTKDFLPPSFVVTSGGGLHLYWITEHFIARDIAQGLAERLKAMTKAKGFRVDPTRTADLASVLRPPGTQNRKRDPIVTVACRDTGRRYTQGDFEAALVDYEAPELPILLGAPPPGMVVDNSDLIDGTFEPTSVRDIARGCRQIRESIVRRGAGDPEPFWKDVLRTLARCTDATDKVLHGVSNGHEGYDAAEVQRKIIHIRSMGPALCASLEANNPGGCDGCPHQDKDRFSPIRLSEEKFQPGTPELAIGPVQFMLPEPTPDALYKFDFAPVGGVQCIRYQTKVPDVDGNLNWTGHWLPMSRTLYMVTGVQREYSSGAHQAVYRFRESTGRIYEAKADMKDLPEPKGLFQFLANAGVVVNTGEKHVRNAHIALNKQWLESIQASRPSTVVYDTFGWSKNDDGDIDGFVGAYHYHVDGSVTPSVLRGGAEDMQKEGVRVKGTLEAWKSVIERFCRPGLEVQQMCILLGLFGPFVAAANLPPSFCPVSLVSKDGGQGKTTTASLAISSWMRPGMCRTQIDTSMRRIKDISTAKNLPYAFDEMTTVKPADMAEIIYNISNGKERARLGSNGQQLPTAENRLPLFITANGTVRDALARALEAKQDAAQSRVVEIEMTKDEALGRELVESGALETLAENYGVAGDWWMRYMLGVEDGNNKLAQFIGEARSMYAKVSRSMPDPATYRFYAVNAATVLLAAKWCEKTGFLPITYAAMEQYMLHDLMADQYGQRENYQLDLVQYVADFLHDNMNKVVEATVIRPMRKVMLGGREQIIRGPGHIELAAVSPEPERFRGDKVVARWEVFFDRFPNNPVTTPAETRLLVAKGAMRTYLHEKHCDVKTFVSACEKAGILTSYRGTDNLTAVSSRALVPLEKKYRENAPLIDVYAFDPSRHESLSGVARDVLERASELLDNNA